MTQELGVDCTCGFTFTTPHGEDDAVAIATFHVQRTHPDMDSSRAAVMKVVKKR